MPDPVSDLEIPAFDAELSCPKCLFPPSYSWHPWAQSMCWCRNYHPHLQATRYKPGAEETTQHLHARCSNCFFYIGVFRTADAATVDNTPV